MERIDIDLFSDTVTRPTSAMRSVIAGAEVGDEQLGEDPTTNALQLRVAELLGKEAALFMPSGAMCNVVSYAVHCRPGDEIMLDRTAHPLHYESGGVAAVAGAQLWPLDGERGVFTAEQVRLALRPPDDVHQPRSRVVSIEQTANAAGGSIWPLAAIEQVADIAHKHDCVVHVDGARLLHAVVATGIDAARWVATADSAWIDFSKGLGCPAGAALAGSTAFIAEARRVKQRLGGSLRQSGMLGAAALHALDHHVDRLADDHAAARQLAEAVDASPGLSLVAGQPESNIVIFDVAIPSCTAEEFRMLLLQRHGVRLSPMGGSQLRAVTHLDVTAAQVAAAGEALLDLSRQLASG